MINANLTKLEKKYLVFFCSYEVIILFAITLEHVRFTMQGLLVIIVIYFNYLAIYTENHFTVSRLNHDVHVFAQKYENITKPYNRSAIATGF